MATHCSIRDFDFGGGKLYQALSRVVWGWHAPKGKLEILFLNLILRGKVMWLEPTTLLGSLVWNVWGEALCH